MSRDVQGRSVEKGKNPRSSKSFDHHRWRDESCCRNVNRRPNIDNFMAVTSWFLQVIRFVRLQFVNYCLFSHSTLYSLGILELKFEKMKILCEFRCRFSETIECLISFLHADLKFCVDSWYFWCWLSILRISGFLKYSWS